MAMKMAEINGGDPITTEINWEPILQVGINIPVTWIRAHSNIQKNTPGQKKKIDFKIMPGP